MKTLLKIFVWINFIRKINLHIQKNFSLRYIKKYIILIDKKILSKNLKGFKNKVNKINKIFFLENLFNKIYKEKQKYFFMIFENIYNISSKKIDFLNKLILMEKLVGNKFEENDLKEDDYEEVIFEFSDE